ncbi:MAG: IMP dehydrogenase [Planctomycetota bacterium]|nr:MAG: IMP dehydrogenase [Planctomycetota bacterium]
MDHKIILDGITFDDVLLIPAYSELTPDMVDTSTRLTRSITVNIPIVSSPMDTVTESDLARALAQEGGVGIIHKNLSPEVQAREVAKVKRSEHGVVVDPVTLAPSDTLATAAKLMAEQGVSGFPVTEDGSRRGKVVGILTRRDMKFLQGKDLASIKVRDVMTTANLLTASPDVAPEVAEQMMSRARVEKLLLVDGEHRLRGLITMRDVENVRTHPKACRDARGRLRVGAAVGVRQFDRAELLIAAEVDVLVVDTAHGHSKNVIDTVREIKRRFSIDVIAGNVGTADGAKALIDAGADAVKVGIGPGSICTTRVVTGVGVPQISAILEAVRAADAAGIPIIADGGVRQSGDIAKALAAGASVVMLGSLLAGLDESPGEVVLHRGRRFKTYRGMGSEGAMAAGSGDRYGQAGIREARKFVPEGVEGMVPFRGNLADFVYQMVGGVRSSMGYCGCKTMEEFRKNTRFARVTSATVVENHPHDITITKEAPNYSSSTMGRAEERATRARGTALHRRTKN